MRGEKIDPTFIIQEMSMAMTSNIVYVLKFSWGVLVDSKDNVCMATNGELRLSAESQKLFADDLSSIAVCRAEAVLRVPQEETIDYRQRYVLNTVHGSFPAMLRNTRNDQASLMLGIEKQEYDRLCAIAMPVIKGHEEEDKEDTISMLQRQCDDLAKRVAMLERKSIF